MAVQRMKKLGQEDSEEQKPLNRLKDIGSAVGNTARTFLMPEAVPESERVYQDSEGPVPPSQTPPPPSTWYQSYGRFAPPNNRMAPMYDDGGEVAPNPMNLPQESFDPNSFNNVGQSAVDSAAQATPETGLHKAEDAVRRAGTAMDDPSTMPGQTANTKQQPIQGLDRNYMTPMYDDGGKVPYITLNRVPGTEKTGLPSVPKPKDPVLVDVPRAEKEEKELQDAQDQASAEAARTTMQNVAPKIYDDGGKVEGPDLKKTPVTDMSPRLHDEVKTNMMNEPDQYPKSTANTKDDKIDPEELDKYNQSKARMKPAVPVYDDGGPVKNDPNDGHHQMAILEEGERVLTPEENKQYEAEHGAPADFGGRVLQQPNPPVHPMTDTEHEAEQPVGGAKMDTSNPPAADVSPAMMRPMSATTSAKPTMASPSGITAPKPTPEEAPSPTNLPAGSAVGGAANAVGQSAMMQPEHNPMATSASATPLPSEREKLESERSALKQKMVDAAEGKFNNGKFDHLAYGEAKMALADLNKAHPWGQPGNHEGILGKIGHGLAVAGELASDAVMGPGFTAAIPGTRENLRAQEAQGQQQITQGLGQKASEAETAYKTALTQTTGRPKDPKQGIAFETYRMNHSAPGTPEFESAKENLAAYQEQDRQMNQNKQAAKPSTLPIEITAQTKKVLSLPKGSPERAQAEEDLKYMEKQAQAGGKLTDRHREIIDYAVANGLDPEDQDQYAQATMGYEKTKTAAKAEGGLPTWKQRAQFQQELNITANKLNNINADATTRGLEADKLQQKYNATFAKDMNLLNVTLEALNQSDTNQVSANVVPLLGTLGIIADVGGVKRLNTQELQKFAPANGSAYRWLSANAEKLAAGELPDGYQDNLRQLVNTAIKEKTNEHVADTQSVDNTVRKGGQEPVVTPNKRGGTTVKPQPSTPQSPATPPAGGGKPRTLAEWRAQQQAAQKQQPKQ